MRIRREQWVPGSCRLHLPGNLSHAAQNLVARSKRHRMERKGFPVGDETECGGSCTEGLPVVNSGAAD